MISLRNHGGNLAGNGFVLVEAHIPLSLKASALSTESMYRIYRLDGGYIN